VTAIAKLIRFHRFQLDEKRRNLKELEERASEIETALSDLAAKIEAEKNVASENYEAGKDFASFIQAALGRREKLDDELLEAQQRVDVAREDVREAFSEVKKYEITKANRDTDAALETTRREQIDLDEVALNNHRFRH
jgi:flagellar protein FliJ